MNMDNKVQVIKLFFFFLPLEVNQMARLQVEVIQESGSLQ